MQDSFSIEGFTFSAVAAGIKIPGSDRLDFGLIVADSPAAAAGVTTTNVVVAAPVEIARERLRKGTCCAILANSGNANAFTGEKGRADALELTAEAADLLRVDPESIIPLSTGVIGTSLPMDRLRSRLTDLVRGRDESRFLDFARSIMTTDTRPKTVLLDGKISGGPLRMLGTAKGAGMIAPDMATMLAVVLIDHRVEASFLKECLVEATEASFNAVTIDGDTSTNDTLLVLAGGLPDAAIVPGDKKDREIFASMLKQVCMDLARQIVSDGEGATKLVEVRVCGAPDRPAATRIARTIAESALVKTAFYCQDPNWGRIVAAAGRAGVDFDPRRLALFIGDVLVVSGGAPVNGDWEQRAAKVMTQQEFSVVLDLNAGQGEASFLTTDLSEEYVRINAAYRT